MKRHIFFACLLLIGGMVSAQKKVNDPNAVARTITSFHSIEVAGGIDLYLTQGEEAIAVSAADPGTRDRIVTKVENGVLKIYFDRPLTGGWNTNRKMKAYVSFKHIDVLRASGGSDVYSDEPVTADALTVHFSGGSDFHGKLDCSSLTLQANGGSDVYVSGKATTASISVSGGSDFHGFDLATENSSVTATGGSDVYITVNKELNVSASGGSDVRYKGNGSVKSVNGGHSASVKRA